ncbi:glycosyl transferase family 1 [Paraburkholderia sp. DHOC27]|uniref:glycosyl transferase family 1 n=1 Tax=Paraburkholderia sp. DHOC27 TaxID=2303330 RepID=UPI00268428FA
MAFTFSLDEFEQLVYRQEHHVASYRLIGALALLSHNYGELDENFLASDLGALPPAQRRERYCARLTSAIATLFSQPGFTPDDACYRVLLTLHQWMGVLFAASATGNADHVIRNLNPRGSADTQFLPGDRFIEKLTLLYSTESELEVNLAALWAHDKTAAARLALVMLAPTFQGSADAHGKREALLQWLPGKLRQIDDLDDLPSAVLHHAYMFCSYADTPQRHAIKQDINLLVRRKLAQLGRRDLVDGPLPEGTPGALTPAVTQPLTKGTVLAQASPASRQSTGRKPLMMVVLEWFGGTHSIYRTHSRTIEAAREHFEVVGFGFNSAIDDAGRAIFDRFIELEQPDYVGESLKTLRDFAEAERPDVLYMPSVGMFVQTIFLSNLRLAPLQIAALGHPATTHSDKIDYLSVEEDYVGDPACFSERLLRLPKDGQPYRASRALPEITHRKLEQREVIKIIVTASAMKVNPAFLDACRAIQERADVPVQFAFMAGMILGLPLQHMRDVIKRAVPGAEVHGLLEYADYLAHVDDADLFLSPFPFGNTNGIVDAFTLGLPGVCKSGPEVFEHIDGALFARAGMPSWTVAETVEDYIAAALRMIAQRKERESLRRQLIETKAVERFFEGRPEAFGERVLELVHAHRTDRTTQGAEHIA